MKECQIRGCRHLQTTCVECGRLVIEKIFTENPVYKQEIDKAKISDWIHSDCGGKLAHTSDHQTFQCNRCAEILMIPK